MSLETSIVAELSNLVEGVPAYYQHLAGDPGRRFIWFIRNGDERLDTIDGTGEPDIIYCDVEVYASTIADCQQIIDALRTLQDHRGAFGAGTIEDISVTDQQDGYEPQASGDSLPPFSAAFRVQFTLYDEE